MRRLTVDVSFCHKPTEAGGRRMPIFSGYRPVWHIGRFYQNSPWLFGGQLELIGTERVAPGECGIGRTR